MSGKNLTSYDDRRGNDVQIIGGELRTGNMLVGGKDQEIDEESATQNFVLGTRKYIDGGERVFVYSHIHASYQLGRGRCAQAYNTAGTEKGAFLGAQINGAYTINWTVVGASIAANQFAEGYLFMQGGFTKRIKSHPAQTIGLACTLTLHEKLTDISLSAGRYGMLIENKYANVISREQAGFLPGLVVGIAPMDFTAGYYGWLQVKGPCGVLSSQNDKGNADAEHAIVAGASQGSECILQAAHGYQVIGYLLPMNTVSWENENFMLVNLNIE